MQLCTSARFRAGNSLIVAVDNGRAKLDGERVALRVTGLLRPAVIVTTNRTRNHEADRARDVYSFRPVSVENGRGIRAGRRRL